MSDEAVTQPACCDPCCEPTTTTTPGPRGLPGAPGTDGTDGVNAYTTTTASFDMPNEAVNVTVAVADASWMAVGQKVFAGKLASAAKGTFQVVQVVSSVSVTLQNVEDTATGAYAENSAPGTTFPSGTTISPSGLQGPSGGLATPVSIANGGTAATNAPDARTNLGLGSMAIQNANAVAITGGNIAGITDLAIADGGTGASTAANARANLGLAIGTNVQAYDATLQSLSALGTAADKIAYTTGVDAWAETAITSQARGLIDDASYTAMRATLGVLPGYGLLGFKDTVDLNVATSDNAITMLSSRYIIDKVTVDNASLNTNTATAGLFTAAGGGGTTLAADQSLAALTASTKFLNLGLQAVTGTDVVTAGTLYFRVGIAQGAADTANVRIFGWNMSTPVA